MRRIERIFILCMLFIGVLAVVAPAWAEEEQFPERFMLRFGGYQVKNAQTIARLDANNLPVGTYVDFNQTLGGDTRAYVTRLDGLYRFNDKHGIMFAWYALRFNGSRVLDQDIVWNGETYKAGYQVDSKLKFDVYKLSYQYSVYHNDTVELGASIGLHIMHVFAGIDGTSTIASGTINISGGEGATAPLPVFGLFADYKFTPRFSAYYNYQVFNINYQDKIRGGLQDLLFGLEYRLFRHVALGAAYNRFSLSADVKGDNSTLHADTNWSGSLIYGAVYF